MTRGAAVAVAALSLVIAPPAHAWGPVGHWIVATIAERLLTDGAARQVRALLAADGSATLADVASWADKVRETRRETGPWHFVDIPLSAPGYDAARDCPGNDCVVEQIAQFRQVLADSKADQRFKVEALKWIVHLVGDLHQPLHCTDDHDRGGNDLRLRFFGRATNLHAVWDHGVIDHMRPADRLAATLVMSIKADETKAWPEGTAALWATEAHVVGQRIAYGALTTRDHPEIGQNYQAIAAPAVELQLKRAGVRLASVLNAAFGSEARPSRRPAHGRAPGSSRD